MRYSKLFGKTVREVPTGVMMTSHQLLLRGGFIREVAAGRYNLLPLGARVYEKVIDLIEKEMEAIGSQRVFTPTLHPKEIWQKTGRDKVWGKSLLSVKDKRTGQEFAMAATGEGLFTEMVKNFNPSYKDLPVYLHQFSQKFRNEKRPRGGLVRLREFLMKDAYSFDASEEAFSKTYQNFYEAYGRIAQVLNIEAIPVEADNGALGGNYSHEFMVLADYGEDKVVMCDTCLYRANTEKAEFGRVQINAEEEVLEFKEIPLPYEVGTIKELVAHYKMPPERFIKNVVYKADGKKIIIATVTGDMEVNETKLKNLVRSKSDLEPATDEDLAGFGAKSGFVHSWGYNNKKIMYVADTGVTIARNLYGGYKTDTTDPINVNYSRDFKVDIVGDICNAYEGAKCPRCSPGKLTIKRAIEFGHVFSYGDFYSKAHGATFVDRDGTQKYILMGAYGIGVERAIAIIIESHNDEKGIIWPENVAPFKFHLVGLKGCGEDVYQILIDWEIEVLYDYRDLSAGEKFADADLIGCPYRLIVSEKTKDMIEIKQRNGQEAKLISLEQILNGEY